MPTTEQRTQPVDASPPSGDALNALIGEQVIRALSVPADLLRVQVRPLWPGRYRVKCRRRPTRGVSPGGEQLLPDGRRRRDDRRGHAADYQAVLTPGRPASGPTGELRVSTFCHVVLNPSATPGQLAAVGNALWSWCTDAAGGGGVYQYLDNQALDDLVAGRLPAADPAALPAERWGVRFSVPDGAFPDRRAALDSLQRAVPAADVANVPNDATAVTETRLAESARRPRSPFVPSRRSDGLAGRGPGRTAME